jgi:hypothetical protein
MRRKRSSYGAAWLLVTLLACSPTEPGASRSFDVLHGTSFNMCVGYCTTVLTIRGTTAHLTESSRGDNNYPQRMRSVELTESEAQRLRTLANREDLTRVEGVHGCPDCADGGVEWIAIRAGRGTIEARYDFRRTLEPIAELQAELRAIRLRFQ